MSSVSVSIFVDSSVWICLSCVLLMTFYCRLNVSWACLLSTKSCVPEAIDEYPLGFVWIPFCWGPSVSLVLDPTFKDIYLCIPRMSMAKVWRKMPSPPSTHLELQAITKFLFYFYGSVYSSLIVLTRRIFRVLDLWTLIVSSNLLLFVIYFYPTFLRVAEEMVYIKIFDTLLAELYHFFLFSFPHSWNHILYATSGLGFPLNSITVNIIYVITNCEYSLIGYPVFPCMCVS